MFQTLTVLDDFFPSAKAIREFALEHDFSTGNSMDGHHYPDTAVPKHEHFKPWFEQLLSAGVGGQVQVNMMAFVVGRHDTKTEQWIHADSNCAKWASVSYLFEGSPDHGTSFWRHRESQRTRMDQGFYDALKIDVTNEEAVQGLVQKIRHEGEDDKYWERQDSTAARLGRTIWFDSKAFHSRTHRFGFGSTPEDARLVLVSFFDIL